MADKTSAELIRDLQTELDKLRAAHTKLTHGHEVLQRSKDQIEKKTSALEDRVDNFHAVRRAHQEVYDMAMELIDFIVRHKPPLPSEIQRRVDQIDTIRSLPPAR